ncbi:MAG: tetratricopeptide repeat protein, partial [Myxococcales bacterium]|nr:tetratricopeptide repeat protein [Myxococcales bacterium]
MEAEERLQPARVPQGRRGLEDHRRALSGLPGVAVALVAALLAIGSGFGIAPGVARAAASGDEVREAIRDWKLGEAEKLLATKALTVTDDERVVLKARLDLRRSRYKDVVKALEPIVAKAPKDFEARVALGRALYALGENGRAYDVLDAMADYYNGAGGLSPRELMWLGVGLHLTDYQKNSNRAFTEAVAADPKLDEARLLWADVLMEKWNFQDADKLLDEVVAHRKDDPGALVGLARIDILSDRDFGKAREKLAQVIAAYPEDVDAHTLMAQLELENERPDAAIAILTGKSLVLAPNDLDALALLAAAQYIADDQK